MLERSARGPSRRAYNEQDLIDAGTEAPKPSASAQSDEFTDTGVVDVPAAALPVDRDAESEPAERSFARPWRRRYSIALLINDLLAATVASAAAFAFRFGQNAYYNRFQGNVVTPGRFADVLFAVLLPLLWICVVALSRGYEARFVGVGTAEFERVFRAFLHLAVLTAFVSYAFKAEIARGYLLIALPLALALDFAGRYLLRIQLHRRRARGASMTPVLAVGGADSVVAFAASLDRDVRAGMQVVGACVPSAMSAADAERVSEQLQPHGVALLGDVDSISEAVRTSHAHSVAVLSGEISPEKLRWISWQLEGTEAELIVSPGLAEIGGRRLHVQPVAGLPLLYVDEPEFSGFRRALKSIFDRTVALALLTFSLPILVGIAALVRLTSRGPALFRQTRVGVNGTTFTVYKFRSMCVDAETRLAQLENADGNDVLFKLKSDPRVTRVGAVLRRYSLDELPQLINVLKGDMSLVGPRPPLPSEVADYADNVRRRLLVKPGMTGLWQISGRSDLSWEESVRLDLRYVENWSIATDMVILGRTFLTVVRGSGAY